MSRFLFTCIEDTYWERRVYGTQWYFQKEGDLSTNYAHSRTLCHGIRSLIWPSWWTVQSVGICNKKEVSGFCRGNNRKSRRELPACPNRGRFRSNYGYKLSMWFPWLYLIVGMPAMGVEELSSCMGRATKREKNNQTVVLEATCKGELWIWNCNSGCRGSMDDIRTWDCSKLVQKIFKGMMVPDFENRLNDKLYSLCYYVV